MVIIPGLTAPISRAAEDLKARYRSEWLNLNLGGGHWPHNHLTSANLKAVHSCPTCRAFRATAKFS